VGHIIALPPKFASLAVDKKVIYQCKRGFFLWGYVYKKGLGLLWASKRNGRVRHTRRSCP